jgi:hypothetical protein
MSKVSFKSEVAAASPDQTSPQPADSNCNTVEATVEQALADIEAAKQAEQPATETVVQSPKAEAAVVLRAPTAVAPSNPYSDEDNIPLEDIVIPRINIVQKVGELSNIFKGGEIVYNKALVLPRPLKFVVVGFKPLTYVQKTTDGSGEVCSSVDEVVNLGGTIDYTEANTKSIPYFQRLATALIFIEADASLNTGAAQVLFPHEHDGKRYGIALWSMKGTAYTNGAKHIFTARKMLHLTKGYRTAFWKLNTELKQFDKNFAYIPKLVADEPTTPEFIEFTKGILGF